MSLALNFSVSFRRLECGECGISFAVTEAKYNRCQEQGESFFCPNGHCRIFVENKIGKLEKELAAAKSQKEWYAAQFRREEKRVAAFKGVTTKLKNRIANGVCPCCKRSFSNLHRHMKNEHPDFNNVSKEA